MSPDKQSFTIRASASRLTKGLLAIPQKFRDLFPSEKGPIQVVFDDGDKAETLTFHPYDPTVKENRIFGLRRWFSKREVQEGDLVSITLEDMDHRLYRIALDRFVRERQEQGSRQKLRVAATDSEAERELGTLSRLTRRRPREVAREELLRIAKESAHRPRPSIPPPVAERHEGVPSGIPSCFEKCMMGNVSSVLLLLKNETANRTLKYTISTRRSATTQATCWSSVPTATLNSSMQQSPISPGPGAGSLARQLTENVYLFDNRLLMIQSGGLCWAWPL